MEIHFDRTKNIFARMFVYFLTMMNLVSSCETSSFCSIHLNLQIAGVVKLIYDALVNFCGLLHY